MNRRMVAVCLSSAMILSLVVIVVEVAPPVSGGVIYVGGGGSGNYSTIQAGINAASPGDTVYVYSGTYNEKVIVNKELFLVGEDADTTIIDGGSSGTVISITSHSVSVICFSLRDAEKGIHLQSTSGCTVHSSKFTDFTYSIYPDNADYNIFYNNSFTGNTYGLYLWSSDGNTAFDNNGSGNYNGFTIYNSNWNHLYNNTSNNNNYGIGMVRKSENNTIHNNNLSHNNWHGIILEPSSNNEIYNNTIKSNLKNGIWLYTPDNMISQYGYCRNNSIYYNIIESNQETGIRFTKSHTNTIRNNTFVNNFEGLAMANSNGNQIFNNFFNNTSNNAVPDTANSWNQSYPVCGNFWSDYTGVDNFKGPNQDIPGSDGIGDTSHEFYPGYIDYYPLMKPNVPDPIGNSTVLSQGWNLISVPLIQPDQNLSAVLETMDGFYDAVQYYDPTLSRDPWKHHRVGKSLGNSLTFLNETMGFWVHITQPGDTIFVYNGTAPAVNQTIKLYQGWNQVGYPSLTNHNRTRGLNNVIFGTNVDCIQWYDAETETWHDMGPNDYFVPTRGYWIHAIIDCEWEVPL